MVNLYQDKTRTPIYTSKKLEKIIKKIILTGDDKPKNGLLGKWNATLFYIDRKKCWLITNAKTQYNVILTDIKSSDLNSINDIFKSSLYEQLKYDKIEISFEQMSEIIGDLKFYPTDNDRKTTGFQNSRLSNFEYWKFEYENYENMPFTKLTNGLNSIPIHIGESKKMDDFTKPILEMRKILAE